MNIKTKFLAIFLTTSALFVGLQSKAQTIQKDKLRFGIGVDGLLPVGNLTNSANFGLGITPRLQYGISNRLALTFTSGIYHFFPKDMLYQNGSQSYKYRYDLDVIPVKAGIKAFITSNIYIGAEAGVGFQVDNGGGDTKFIFSPAIGYASKKWDIGIRYENIPGNGYKNEVIALRLAYGFGL